MIPAIGPILIPATPVSNAQPFTYRDGATFLDRLERIARSIDAELIPAIDDSNKELVENINTEVNNLIKEFNIATGKVDQAVDDVINNSVELQETVVTQMLNNEASGPRQIVDNLLSEVVQEDDNDEGTFIVKKATVVEGEVRPDPTDPGFFV